VDVLAEVSFDYEALYRLMHPYRLWVGPLDSELVQYGRELWYLMLEEPLPCGVAREEELELFDALVLLVVGPVVLNLLWSWDSSELQVLQYLSISHFILHLWLF
jgi:hypothetical protein